MLIFIVSAVSETQWSALVTGRYMITMMVLLCYVNLSGTSLECIVIVLMNNLLLGGQFCTDSVDVQQNGEDALRHDRTAIIPRLNFTCNGRIISITAKLWFNDENSEYPFFQVWRPASAGSTIYNKIGEVQLRLDHLMNEVGGNNQLQVANIILTGNNTIEVQSGDVVGYYHPPDAHYRVRTTQTDGYILYQFKGSHESVDLNNAIGSNNERQPLIQFTVGKHTFCNAYSMNTCSQMHVRMKHSLTYLQDVNP